MFIFMFIAYWYCVVLWMLGLGKPEESLLVEEMVEQVVVRRGRWLEDAELDVMRLDLGKLPMPMPQLTPLAMEKLAVLVGGMMPLPPPFPLSL